MKRLAATLLFVRVFAALAVAGAADDTPGTAHQVRIPHADGSGRATLVEVPPRIGGTDRFVHSTPEPIPRPGEIIVPIATPGGAPSPAASRPHAPR